MNPTSPLAVVQAQLDAYNAKDLDALMRTYAPDAQQFALHGGLLAQGIDAIRPRYQERFGEPDLHARLLTRSVIGNFVTDLEIVTRNFPEGLGTVEMLCVYEVVDGHIVRASFATGEKRMS
ncbi:nuclear transport factor 2 family protein [Telluria aromaticivorans]|uniref:SnoaL-like domain-containing protein n=1 Tax=Telluria aromaticivorans TaxID=2725995 RepID=A0A7Y2P1I9_9BURK|nr:nuclear transport factor 2 family protein [Telluria aromaticivorans]NNG25284.1 SnoaL-like domain-containing protein [Telluria aromaticivorans]